MREQHDLAVGELKGIIVRIWILRVDLSEPSHRVTDVLRFFLEKAPLKSRNLTLDFLLERDLGARKKAHRHVWFSYSSKTARDRVRKICCHQFVSDRRRSGCNMVQTVVAHGRGSYRFSAPPACSTIEKIHGQIMKHEQPRPPRGQPRDSPRPFFPTNRPAFNTQGGRGRGIASS